MSGLPDQIYTFGYYDNEVSRQTINFTQEVKGIYLLPNFSPDFEGIIFYLEDGTYERIGVD